MHQLYTKYATNLPAVPWQRYPRPQLRRERWLCLNGTWDLSILDRKSHSPRYEGTVLVPFCAESALSGVSCKPSPGDTLLYRRTFTLPEDWQGQRILLHFGAVSREAEVAVNGTVVCRSVNGYLPFQADITDALWYGENQLTLRVINDLSPLYPWGKQREKRGGMWYTPCSGIWQTVWLEPVPRQHIRAITVDTKADSAVIRVEGAQEGAVLLGDTRWPLQAGEAHIQLQNPVLWSPDHPHLYYFTVEAGEDRVESYFALRTLSVQTLQGHPRLCLNGAPFFFHGLLDQGYWSDGLYTPAAPEAYEEDILAMKALGFNTLRKHIKVEPEQFYYDCDRLGMIVFQDMVNNGKYRYIRDTVLPTLHLQKRRDKHLHRSLAGRLMFLQSMRDTVTLLRSHPCICLWTIFNEGWGQFEADDAYRQLKALDPTRFVDTTSGWFHQKSSDVDSLHLYFDRLHLGTQNRPQLLSEFGGISWKVPGHCFNTEKTYGYSKYETREAYIAALTALYREQLLPLVPQGLCGAIYTQVSDVEDETNGLITFDRAVLKATPGELHPLADCLRDAMADAQKAQLRT